MQILHAEIGSSADEILDIGKYLLGSESAMQVNLAQGKDVGEEIKFQYFVFFQRKKNPSVSEGS